MSCNQKDILVIGASGLVGYELVSILLCRGTDATTIIATATGPSVGKSIDIEGKAFVLKQTHEDLFQAKPLVFQCATNEAAEQWVPIAIDAGCQVIDCSSVYRQDQNVPLVIPCVNGDELQGNPQLIAGPNCTTIILLTAIHGLQKAFGVQTITVATYQALSGAGRVGLEALESETAGNPATTDGVFPEPCAFNVFCHESTVNPMTGFNGEEEKVIEEVHRICCDDAIQVIPTCMRVPVRRVHTESITLTINGKVSEQQVLDILHATPEVVVFNDEGHFPTALKASGGDSVLVGHVRVVACNVISVDTLTCITDGDTTNTTTDISTSATTETKDTTSTDASGGKSTVTTIVSLVACGDQIRTGAALNAVRIAEKLKDINAESNVGIESISNERQ